MLKSLLDARKLETACAGPRPHLVGQLKSLLDARKLETSKRHAWTTCPLGTLKSLLDARKLETEGATPGGGVVTAG